MNSNELKFVQCEKDNKAHRDILLKMVIPYFEEIYTDCEDNSSGIPSHENTVKFSDGMIDMQGADDRHLELCYEKDTPIGFFHIMADHEDKPGYGFVMEFYVLPKYRRCGIGKKMFHRIETLFDIYGVTKLYLNSDTFTGIPFFESLGFENIEGQRFEKIK